MQLPFNADELEEVVTFWSIWIFLAVVVAGFVWLALVKFYPHHVLSISAG